MIDRVVKMKSKAEMRAAVPEIQALINRLGQLLAGQDPDIAGAALADLMAMLLASHFVKGGAKETKKLRVYLLKHWVEAIEELIPIHERIILRNHKGETDG